TIFRSRRPRPRKWGLSGAARAWRHTRWRCSRSRGRGGCGLRRGGGCGSGGATAGRMAAAAACGPSARMLYICAMSKITVKIINHSPHPLPAYATEGSAGMDLRANLIAPLELKPLERQMVPTGIQIELPPGFEAQVRPRSGLAAKHGITCLNSPGTVDSDYRGELKVILINLSSETQVLHPGDRIAQLVVGPVVRVGWEEVEEIGVTARNTGGFGHTGKS